MERPAQKYSSMIALCIPKYNRNNGGGIYLVLSERTPYPGLHLQPPNQTGGEGDLSRIIATVLSCLTSNHSVWLFGVRARFEIGTVDRCYSRPLRIVTQDLAVSEV